MKQPFWMAAGAALFFTGCGDSGPVEITKVREYSPENDFEIPVLAESDATRFRYSADPKVESSLDLPEGWKELPATTMRNPNLRFGPNNEGECYVTTLSGGGGGMAENVNRWLGQFGAEKLTEEQVADLPKKTFFGEEATLVSAEGTFEGMGTAAKENYKLHGLILMLDGTMVTLKMTGPKDLVNDNIDKFDEFCESISSKGRN